MDGKRPRVVVVGGVAGGASCAARLRRLAEYADISVYDKGSFVSFANCGLPYYVGNTITAEDKLVVATPDLFHRRFNINVFTQHEVTNVHPDSKSVDVTNLATGEKMTENFDALVLSTGASAIIPPVPGVVDKDGIPRQPGVFVLRTIPDSNQIKQWITDHNAKSATVIGAAWAGLEVAEALHGRGLKVNVLELAPQVMPLMDEEMTIPLKMRMLNNGVNLVTGEGVAAIHPGDDGCALKVLTSKGTSIPSDLVILSVGVKVENKLATAAGAKLGVRGSVVVDDTMRTTVPWLWAVGDMIETRNFITGAPVNLALAGPANKQGRIAAESIALALETGDFDCAAPTKFRGVQGTAIMGMFDLAVAMTGLTERQAKLEAKASASEMNVASIWIHPGHHVAYYPGATPVHLKLVFDAKTGKIYGAQAVGQHGIDKRIDVIAMAIQMRATVMDLVQAELCYSPQYGAAKDPVNIAGMVASNIVQGLVPLTPWDAVWDIVRKDQSTIPPVERLTVLDVRYCDEVEAEGTLTTPEGVAIPVVNIPLPKLRSDPTVFDTIRDSLPEPNAPVAVLCREGVRANSAVRLLRQHGFDARLLSGGFYTALLMKGAAFPARTVSVDDDRFPERPDTMTGACASPESKKPKL